MLSLWLEMCGMAALAESYANSAAAFLKQTDNYLYTRLVSRAGGGGGTEGDNEIGDVVESFGDGEGGTGGEMEGDNEIGDELPQDFGEMSVKHYWIG